MTGKRTQIALAGALLVGVSAPAMAETSTDLQGEVAALRAELAEMRQQQDEQWLTERRAEEIKGLVKDVLSDAETRASLLAEGATAGIDEKGKIFLKSADGAWKANFSGQIQFRYLYNEADRPAGQKEDTEDGFQMRRVKLGVSGHIADPKIYYKLVFATERDVSTSTRSFTDSGGDTGSVRDTTKAAGDVLVEDAYFGYKFDNGMFVQAGISKLPFARQELISSSRQTAVDRSIVTEYFTLDRAEQIQVGYSNDTIKVVVAGSDGADNQFTDPLGTGDQAHSFAVTGRLDWKVMGDWGQMKDELAWAGEDTALFVGVAGHWENNKDNGPGSTGNSEWYAVTVDALLEVDPFSVTGAVFYAEEDNSTTTGTVADLEAMGFYVQGAVNLDDTWAPFIRYNWLEQDPDAPTQDALQAVTVGVNYFFRKHNAKLTADVVYLFEGESLDEVGDINGGELSSGLGLTSKDNDEDEFAVRVQFQLLF